MNDEEARYGLPASSTLTPPRLPRRPNRPSGVQALQGVMVDLIERAELLLPADELRDFGDVAALMLERKRTVWRRKERRAA